MNCNQYREWMSAELDGRLDEQSARLLNAHLAACPACRQVKADLAKTVGLLRALPEIEPPPGLAAAVRQRLAAAPLPAPLAWRILLLPQTRLALAAALLLIIVIYGYQPHSLFTRVRQDDRDRGAARAAKAVADARSASGALADEQAAEERPTETRGLTVGMASEPLAAGGYAAGPAPHGQDADFSDRGEARSYESRAQSGEKKAVVVPPATRPQPLPGLSAAATRAKAGGAGGGGGVVGDVARVDGISSVPASAAQTGLGKELKASAALEAAAKKPDTSFKQARARDAAALQPAEPQAEMPLPASAPMALAAAAPPAKAELRAAEKAEAAAAPARAKAGDRKAIKVEPMPEPSVLVVTSDPASVLRVLAPYQQARKQDWSKDDKMRVGAPGDKSQPLPDGRAVPDQPQDASVVHGVGEEGQEQTQAAMESQQAAALESGARPAEAASELQAANEILLTVWVPAGEYPELLNKIRLLGETSEEIRSGSKVIFKTGSSRVETMCVQFRIRRK